MECATSEAVLANLPPTLSRLQKATAATERDEAWAEFVAAHSDTVLHTCRAVARDRDAAMDGYAHALEALREDGCRRLRAYVPEEQIKFSSWLVVVTRRLVLDYFRQRYGRSRSDDRERRDEQLTRRRLEDLVGAQIEPDQLTSGSANSPDAELRRRQLTEAVRRALAELEPVDRLLLALRFQDDRPVREIAKTLGLRTVFHVYRRLGAVLATLRGALAHRGISEAEP